MTAQPATRTSSPHPALARRIRLGLVAAAVPLLASACAAGQQAMTAEESPVIDGTAVRKGDIEVHGLAIKAPPSGASYGQGALAELVFVVTNIGTEEDTLTDISSPNFSGSSISAPGPCVITLSYGSPSSQAAGASSSPSSSPASSSPASSSSASSSSAPAASSSSSSGPGAGSATSSSAPTASESSAAPAGSSTPSSAANAGGSGKSVTIKAGQSAAFGIEGSPCTARLLGLTSGPVNVPSSTTSAAEGSEGSASASATPSENSSASASASVALHPGDSIPVTLTFEKAGTTDSIQVPVQLADEPNASTIPAPSGAEEQE